MRIIEFEEYVYVTLCSGECIVNCQIVKHMKSEWGQPIPTHEST